MYCPPSLQSWGGTFLAASYYAVAARSFSKIFNWMNCYFSLTELKFQNVSLITVRKMKILLKYDVEYFKLE